MNLWDAYEMRWLNEPARWSVDAAGALAVECDPETDFWQRTHYGFSADNGHFRYAALAGKFTLEAHIAVEPRQQYDQAGLMVRLSPDCWLKTSVEYEPGEPNRLGAVVTNAGYSDWSTQDAPDPCTEYWLRLHREESAYVIEASLEGARWTQIRVCRLLEDPGFASPVAAGAYACSPKGGGFRALYWRLALLQAVPQS